MSERDVLAIILGCAIIILGLVLIVRPHGYLKFLEKTASRLGIPTWIYTPGAVRAMGVGAVFLGIIMIVLFQPS